MASVAHLGAGALSGSASVLSLRESTGLQSSLPLLQKNYKFSKVFFWGKITGTAGEYLIAMGIEESFAQKTFFFCQDAVSWAQLPPVTKEMKSDCAKLSVPGGMLSGDPAKVIDLPADAPAEETEEEVPPKPVEEVTRLAVMVSMIDMECAMLPAGALVMQPGGKVEGSLTFKGLDYAKATTLKSYVFINQPKEVSVNADAVTASTDFLTPCDEMVPKGALVCKFDESMNVVSWRSLVYEGFVGYSVVGAPMHGYCYFGTGQKNADLAFMLP